METSLWKLSAGIGPSFLEIGWLQCSSTCTLRPSVSNRCARRRRRCFARYRLFIHALSCRVCLSLRTPRRLHLQGVKILCECTALSRAPAHTPATHGRTDARTHAHIAQRPADAHLSQVMRSIEKRLARLAGGGGGSAAVHSTAASLCDVTSLWVRGL